MLTSMASNPFRWIWRALTAKTQPGVTDRIDPNDNQYRRMKFMFRGTSGIYGKSFRRLSDANNPKPLEEDL